MLLFPCWRMPGIFMTCCCRYIHGCIEVCHDVDGCNSGERKKAECYLLLFILLIHLMR